MPKILSVAIGTSTGGIAALCEILPKFPKTDIYAMFIALHLFPSSEIANSIAKRLDSLCQLKVKKAEHGTTVVSGNAYFLPGGYHTEVKEEGGDVAIVLNKRPKVNFVRPSIDVLMKSVAEVFKEKSTGVLLTGMGKDGSMGMKAVKEAGGNTLAQDESTSSVFSMPRSAIKLGCVDKVLPLQDIPRETLCIMEEKTRIFDV